MDLHRSPMRGNLRQELAHQCRIRRILLHLGLVVEIRRRTAARTIRCGTRRRSGCPRSACPAEILSLLGDVWADDRLRDVRDRILDAVVEPGGPPREIANGHHADAGLAADEPLGSEQRIGQGQNRADAELAIQLVQRRRAEARADVAPDDSRDP